MKHILKQGILAGIFIFALAASGTVIVRAMPGEDSETQTTTQESRDTAKTETETENRSATRTEARVRLADAKLKMCQNREKSITNIMARIGDRGQKQLDLFTKIAERTEKFYVEKGKVLANYDALVAEVNAKASAAQLAVDAVKATTVEFKCDGDNPKGVASTFKDLHKAEIVALKAYKTAVKNLIVGVKSVQSTTEPATGATN